MSEIINKTYRSWYDENGNEVKDYYETSADQVKANDGNTLEEKVGDIDGITDSLTSTSTRIAASANAIKTVNDSMVINGTHFYFDYQNNKYGYNTDQGRGADTFFPFKRVGEPLKLVGASAYGFYVYDAGTTASRNISVTNASITFNAIYNAESSGWSGAKMASNDYFDLTDASYIMYTAVYTKGEEFTGVTDYFGMIDESGGLIKVVDVSNLPAAAERKNYIDVRAYSGKYKFVFGLRTGTYTAGYPSSSGKITLYDITIL